MCKTGTAETGINAHAAHSPEFVKKVQLRRIGTCHSIGHSSGHARNRYYRVCLIMASIALFLLFLFYCPVPLSMTPSMLRTDPSTTSNSHPRLDPRIQLTESYIFLPDESVPPTLVLCCRPMVFRGCNDICWLSVNFLLSITSSNFPE